MSIDVTAETHIARPIDQVAAYVMDPAHDPIWIGGISEARILTDASIGLGARVQRVAHFLGKRIDYTNEVTEFDPPNRLVMRTIAGPFPMVVHYQFDRAGDGTLVRVRNQGSTGGFYRLADPLRGRRVRRRDTGDLKTPQRLLDSAGAGAAG
jgi:uncharacterized protein YndB with AHSA1/START domain